MRSSNNINIASRSMLPSPGAIRSELPLSIGAVNQIVQSRQEICDIFDGKSDRILAIVGPCSIHDISGALSYAARLKELSAEIDDAFLPVMRVYFEKPRTTVGWKGLIYDPDINGSYNIEKGIFIARKLLLKIIDMGLPAGSEMLDPILAQYIADAVSWAAIGARTTEAQTHRQLGSGLSMPVGFKNATDGTFQTAIDAVNSARSEHSFIGVMEDGHVGVFRTKGNSYAHIVLRGGNNQSNYGAEHIAFLKVMMKKASLTPNVIVDCSHANSGKKPENQGKVFNDVITQIAQGENAIKGVMLESFIKPGRQDLECCGKIDPELSITDGCIGWDETASLLRAGAELLRKRRKKAK